MSDPERAMIPRELGERIRFHSFRASFFGGGLVGGLAVLMHFRNGVPEGMLAMGVIAGAIAGSFLYLVDRGRNEKLKPKPGEPTDAGRSTHDESNPAVPPG